MKKVLILTSSGGGGTLSASTAIEEYLKNNHEVTTVHVFKELLKPIDFCSKVTFKKYSCEDLYNIFIPRKCFRMLTLLYHIGRVYIQLKKKSIHTILRNYIINNKPSIIISVVPVINNIILSIAEELNIPFLLMPTDLDINMYILNITNPTYTKFYISLPFHDTQLTIPLKNALIPASQISILGAPLRHDFFMPKNIESLKNEFNIPHNKPVIMILMGAQGSNGIAKYINQITKIDIPAHLIVCTGKNGKQLSNIILPNHITLSAIQFTSRIADLMSLSDLIFTKSGSLSVCEAIYMNTPLLLDATSKILPWEKFNHTFIKMHQFGTSINHYSDIAPIISSLLSKPETLNIYKDNLMQLKKENIKIEILKYIQDILI